jgi:uncharacterized protein (DUF697 family)
VSSFFDYTVSCFTGIFRFDLDPLVSEEENVRTIIHQTAFVCSALTWIQPIPLADFMLLTPLHAKMTVHIGKAKGFEISDERALEIIKELIGAVGLTFISTHVIIGVGKFVPVLFGLYLFPLFYASTWALGKVVEHYFDARQAGRILKSEDLRRVYKKALISGKVLASKLNLNDIKKKAAELKEQFQSHHSKASDSEEKKAVKITIKPQAPAGPRLSIKARDKGQDIDPGAATKQAATAHPDLSSGHPRSTAPTPGIAEQDPIEALEELSIKLKSGSISKEEFQIERRRLLKFL